MGQRQLQIPIKVFSFILEKAQEKCLFGKNSEHVGNTEDRKGVERFKK